MCGYHAINRQRQHSTSTDRRPEEGPQETISITPARVDLYARGDTARSALLRRCSGPIWLPDGDAVAIGAAQLRAAREPMRWLREPVKVRIIDARRRRRSAADDARRRPTTRHRRGFSPERRAASRAAGATSPSTRCRVAGRRSRFGAMMQERLRREVVGSRAARREFAVPRSRRQRQGVAAWTGDEQIWMGKTRFFGRANARPAARPP